MRQCNAADIRMRVVAIMSRSLAGVVLGGRVTGKIG
jgi:hypothetical protein